MTPESIGRMRNGSLLRGVSGASKCDRLNVEWSKQKQWFRYDDTDPLNFAFAWQQWELKYPCPINMREVWPAFSATGNAIPIAPWEATQMHRELLTHAIGLTLALLRTLHSYRATLASKFAAARASGIPISDGTIQVHLRWKTLSALQSYLKITPQAFADNTALAVRMDAGPHLSNDLPEFEPSDSLFDIEQSLNIIKMGDAPPSDSTLAIAEAPQSGAQTKQPKAQRVLSLAAPTLDNVRQHVTICGSDEPVQALGRDSWGIIGEEVNLPNEAWGEEDGGYTLCQVEHLLGKYTFPDGSSAIAYAISIKGDDSLFAMKANFIGWHLEPTKKASIRKKGAPRAVPP